MSLTKPGELKELLARYGFQPTKRFGQHFLVSDRVVSLIMAPVEGCRSALEIGPGIGVLTQPLCALVDRVVAYEVDGRCVEVLRETAPQADVRHQDVLQASLGEVLAGLEEPRAIVSNMPYNITGAILNAVADAKGSFVVAVLMMQKEVAERIQAQPGDSDRGSLSVFLQALFDIQKVASAPKGAFMPPPKVDSTVLAFRPKETGLEPAREKLVLKIVRSGFCQPRKTVANNLMTDAGIDRASTVERLKGLGLAEGARPHQLTWQQWIGLTP